MTDANDIDLRAVITGINQQAYNANDKIDRAMLFLAGALVENTTSWKKISRRTGLNSIECALLGKTARQQQIFIGRRINHHEWFAKIGGGVAFIIDAMCLVGILNRVKQ